MKFCPPPENFKPVQLVDIATAHISGPPPFIRRKSYTGKRKHGIQYEYQVQEYLSMLSGLYVPGFWIAFRLFNASAWSYCQPDGVHIDVERGVITLVEIKYSHTPNAWWQTKMLYAPVLCVLFPQTLWRYEFLEVVKWYDCSTPFPEEVKLVANPFVSSDMFKVHIWRP